MAETIDLRSDILYNIYNSLDNIYKATYTSIHTLYEYFITSYLYKYFITSNDFS